MKKWIIFNEFWVVFWLGYGGSGMVFGWNELVKMFYIVVYNIICVYGKIYW